MKGLFTLFSRGLTSYLQKMRGGGRSSPHPLQWRNAFCSWFGGFIGIALVGLLAESNELTRHDNLFLIGSFGATAVLLYGAPAAPFSQPRYVLGGHIISALVGVTVFKLLPEPVWLASALAVSSAIMLMYLTMTTHPPGGATALIAVIGSEKVHQLGYWYVLEPVLEGVVLLLVIALLINNLSPHRKYPNYWF
ncbi:MAG: HPP family protein [Thiolinea sp.]